MDILSGLNGSVIEVRVEVSGVRRHALASMPRRAWVRERRYQVAQFFGKRGCSLPL